MDLRHLRSFVAVARERSFSRAAEILNIAQPPLSRQIQQLEGEFGVRLFDRSTRPTQLTEQGRLFLEQAVQVLERVDEMQSLMRRMRDAERNIFGIGFVASTLYGYLPEVIRSFRAERPDVDLTLLELFSLEQIAALKDRRIDVAFGRIPIDDPAITRQLLRNERMIVALPSEHPLTERPGPLRVSDLAPFELILYPKSPRPSYADQVLSVFRERDVRPASLHEVRELQTALGLVAAGVGLCLVPAAVERLRRDNVVYRTLDEVGAVSPIYMQSRRGGATPEVARLLALVRAMYQRDGIPFGR